MRFSTVASIAALTLAVQAAPADKRADLPVSDLTAVVPTSIIPTSIIPTDIIPTSIIPTALPTDIIGSLPTDELSALTSLIGVIGSVLELLESLPVIGDLPIVSDLLSALAALPSSLTSALPSDVLSSLPTSSL